VPALPVTAAPTDIEYPAPPHFSPPRVPAAEYIRIVDREIDGLFRASRHLFAPVLAGGDFLRRLPLARDFPNNEIF